MDLSRETGVVHDNLFAGAKANVWVRADSPGSVAPWGELSALGGMVWALGGFVPGYGSAIAAIGGMISVATAYAYAENLDSFALTNGQTAYAEARRYAVVVLPDGTALPDSSFDPPHVADGANPSPSIVPFGLAGPVSVGVGAQIVRFVSLTAEAHAVSKYWSYGSIEVEAFASLRTEFPAIWSSHTVTAWMT